MNNSTVDPMGICAHAFVERVANEQHNNIYDESWECTGCKKRFLLLPEMHEGKLTIMEPQLTLRDQFAMAAMSGLLSNPPGIYDRSNSWIAEWAFKMADAMMKARKSS